MFKTKFHNLSTEKQRSILRGMINAGTNHEGQSNREFCQNSKSFQSYCENVGVESTPRQASKFRRNLGAAYKGTKNV